MKRSMRMLLAAAVAVAAVLAASATAGAAGGGPSGPFFGSGDNGVPGASGSAMQVTYNGAHVGQLTSTGDGYGIADVNFPSGSTFSGLTSLSTDYVLTQGTCVGGAPRYQIDLLSPDMTTGISLFLYFGTPPFGGCGAGMQSEANVIGGSVPEWQVFGGGFNSNIFYTYSQVQSMFGNWSLEDAQIAVDGGWDQTGGSATSGTQQVLVMNWNVNGTVFFPYPGGNASCTGTLADGTYTNVTVPDGATCMLDGGVVVTQDLTVGKGATLTDNGATIGHDLKANGAAGITISGGSVGHDLAVQKSTGGVSIDGLSVGHDLKVEGNAGPTDVSNNTVGHDASCRGDGVTGSGNTAGHNNSCPMGGSPKS